MPAARSHAQPPASSPPSRWTSIERQLPLLIFVLLVPVVVLLIAFTYGIVRSDLERTAVTRMRACASEIANSLDDNLGRRQRAASMLAGREQVIGLFTAPRHERASHVAAVRNLLREIWRDRPRTQVIEFWSLDGELLLRDTHPWTTPDGTPLAPPACFDSRAPTSTGVHALREGPGGPWFEVVSASPPPAEERDRPGGDRRSPALPTEASYTSGTARSPQPPVGHVVVRRPATERGPDLVGRLIGTNAALRVGNLDGSLWTDMAAIVPAPARDPLVGTVFEGEGGALRAGVGVPVAGAPWCVWVEADAGELLAAADNVALRAATLGALLLVLGGAGAVWISRRVTLPLREATRAAAAIAAGHYDRRLVVRREDEVGQLARSFNQMATHVERGRDELEERVAARTAALGEALGRLRDAQEDLVRKEKLALLGQLAGSVGHELRNPLGVMANIAHWLAATLGAERPEVREQIAVLRRQISLSEKITTDLLDVARTRGATATAVPLPRIVEDQVERLGPVPFVIERDFAADVDPARVDAVHIGQVVFNLLTNAAQVLHDVPGGRLLLRLRQEGGHVRLDVEDNGPGVPAALREKVFEPLFTTRACGIGLGLAVSRRLCEDNGGELVLEDPAGGRGARFVLRVPATRLVDA